MDSIKETTEAKTSGDKSEWPPKGIRWYYSDSAVAIAHADCRDILLQLGPVDLVLTDPPYGVGIAAWDKFIPPQEWLPLCLSMPCLIFPSIGKLFDYPAPSWILSWIRDNSTQRNGTGGFNHWEPILFYGKDIHFSKDSIRALDHGGHDYHPSVKPIYLIKWLIDEAGAQIILDPFMGSGTTLVAAQQLGRRAIGIETEERYCAVAVERLRQQVLPLQQKSNVSEKDEQSALLWE